VAGRARATSGTLDLAAERVRSFGLNAVNEAVTYAASHGGPFDRTTLTPPAH
jgi:alcohol dehydrogenase